MLHAVDEHDLLVLEDLIDDSIVAPPGRVQSFEFSKERFPQALWVLCDGPENRCECCRSQLFWKSVQVSKTFRCDLGFVHQVFLDAVFQRQPFAPISLFARSP
jgi:hypothetical protein